MLSSWNKGTPAHRRYLVRTFSFMLSYAGICVAMMTSDVLDSIIGRPTGWVLAAIVSAPVVGQIWATLALMRESDEFVRAVTAKQFIVAAGIAMAVAVFWGFGETFADAPHLPAWLVYAVFWAAVGLVTPFIRTTRA